MSAREQERKREFRNNFDGNGMGGIGGGGNAAKSDIIIILKENEQRQ